MAAEIHIGSAGGQRPYLSANGCLRFTRGIGQRDPSAALGRKESRRRAFQAIDSIEVPL